MSNGGRGGANERASLTGRLKPLGPKPKHELQLNSIGSMLNSSQVPCPLVCFNFPILFTGIFSVRERRVGQSNMASTCCGRRRQTKHKISVLSCVLLSSEIESQILTLKTPLGPEILSLTTKKLVFFVVRRISNRRKKRAPILNPILLLKKLRSFKRRRRRKKLRLSLDKPIMPFL